MLPYEKLLYGAIALRWIQLDTAFSWLIIHTLLCLQFVVMELFRQPHHNLQKVSWIKALLSLKLVLFSVHLIATYLKLLVYSNN